jgi:hypothetical protein
MYCAFLFEINTVFSDKCNRTVYTAAISVSLVKTKRDFAGYMKLKEPVMRDA